MKTQQNTEKRSKIKSFYSFSNLAMFGAKIQIFEKLAKQSYLFTVFGVKSSNENIFGIFSELSFKKLKIRLVFPYIFVKSLNEWQVLP